MSTTSYDIAVRLSMSTAGFGAGAGMAMKLLGDLEGKSTQAEAAIAKLASSMGITSDVFLHNANKMGTYQTQIGAMTAAHANLATAMGGVGKLVAGVGLIGVGLAGVGAMKGWVSAASELQSAMTGVQLATVGTRQQLDQLGSMTFDIAAKTRFSAPDISAIEKLAATAGLNKRSDLISALPTLGNAAEVALQMKGVSYQESVPAFVQMAHLFQSYGGKKFNSLLDLAGRASVLSGDTPSSLENTLKYIMPAVNAYGLTPEDAISVSALASNVGLSGGRGGGSRIQAMFRGIAPLMSSRGGIHNRAIDEIQKLGGHQFFKNGNFEQAGGVTNLLKTTMRALRSIPNQAKRMSLLNAAFGTAGGTALSSLATPGAVTRFQSIQGLLGPGGIASTSTMQQAFNSTISGQMATEATDLHSISTILGQQLLPILAPIVHGIVQITGALMSFLSHHKDVAQFVAVFTLVATTAALIVGPILAVAGAMQILTVAGVTTSIAFGPITLAIVGIAAAIAAGVWVWQHWGDIMKALSPVMEFFITPALNAMGQSLSAVGNFIGILFEPIGRMIQAFGKWADVSHILGNLFSWMGDKLHGFLQFLGILHDGPVKAPGSNPLTIPKSTYKAGQVQPGQVIGGTVGGVGGTYIPPIKGAKGGGGGMAPAVPITIHVHIAAGAVVNHIAPGHGHDPAKIADEVTTRSADALVKGFRDALAHSGTGPITTLYPTLHRTS